MPLWSKSKEEKNPLINKETPEERTQRERSELLTPPKKAGYRATDTDTESVPSAKPTASRLKVRKKYHPPVTTDEAYTSDEESACVSFPVARSITPIVQVAAAGDESQEEIQPAPLLNNNAEDKTVFLRSVQISFMNSLKKIVAKKEMRIL